MFYSIVFVLWAAAGYFFVVMTTSNKSASPANNRDLNRECIFMNFYDSHCIWHFLSSNALLLSALRAIYLSSPCKFCKYFEQEEIEDEERREEELAVKERQKVKQSAEGVSDAANENIALSVKDVDDDVGHAGGAQVSRI